MPTAAWICRWSARPSASTRASCRRWATPRSACATPRNGPRTSTTRRTAFVESFEAEYGRLPSLYASQGFDTANLLISARWKRPISGQDAFRAALRAADFDSTRGDFAFNTNHHPIQDIYVREVIKEGEVFTNRIVETALEDHGDAYADECGM